MTKSSVHIISLGQLKNSQ